MSRDDAEIREGRRALGRGVIFIDGRTLRCDKCGGGQFERFLRWYRCASCREPILRLFQE